MHSPMIHVQGLTKTYGAVQALAGIDLDIAAGECFGLAGTNGAGRTTLLNILATLVRATAGEATIAGVDVRRQPFEVRRRIGYTAESVTFSAALTVREYLSLSAAARRLEAPRSAEAVEAVLLGLQLAPHDDLRTLSKGCRQMLAVAAALLHEPEVLLMDEPITHLDPVARQWAYALLRERHRQGSTILLASNGADDLDNLCDRVGVLHQGRLVQTLRRTGERFDIGGVMATLSRH